MTALAWVAHLYTALGVVLALLSTLLVWSGSFRSAFIWLSLAVIIDGTDGLLARALRVKERLPFFDGALLDNIIDFLTYAFVPVLLMIRANLLPEGGRDVIIGAVVLLASAYGFSRTDAKSETPDYFFTGFPSYWNIVALYLYVFRFEQDINSWILLMFSALVFVPLRYVYPSRTRVFRIPTMIAASVWAIMMAWMVWRLPETGGPWALISLFFPAYYFVLSLWFDRRSRR